MRSIALRLFAFVALIVLAAAWTKEGQLLLFFSFLLSRKLLYSHILNLCDYPDYEIFRINDELAAAEGPNVTFYGTFPLSKRIPLPPPKSPATDHFPNGQIFSAPNPTPTKMN